MPRILSNSLFVQVTASIELYAQMSEQCLPTPAKCHYLFNLRDVSKIFQGIYMAQPTLFEDRDIMARLWMHESYRAFGDRLIMNSDREQFEKIVDGILENRLQSRFHDMVTDSDGNRKNPIFAHLSLTNTEAESPAYDAILDKAGLKQYMNVRLDDYNEIMKKKPLNLVMFQAGGDWSWGL